MYLKVQFYVIDLCLCFLVNILFFIYFVIIFVVLFTISSLYFHFVLLTVILFSLMILFLLIFNPMYYIFVHLAPFLTQN
jgi:hypothetical protein